MTMAGMGYVIRPVQSAEELAEVFDVMGAQFSPARTRAHRSFTELARLFPERRTLMLLAEDVLADDVLADDVLAEDVLDEDHARIVGGAYVGARDSLGIALVPEARGQGLGTRLARQLEETATWLGLPAIYAGGVTDRTRPFYLSLGYHGRASLMTRELPLSALRRNPVGWHYDLASLRARRQQRQAAASRLDAASWLDAESRLDTGTRLP
jgi:GNAT superfamily N-acetyltransferase